MQPLESAQSPPTEGQRKPVGQSLSPQQALSGMHWLPHIRVFSRQLPRPPGAEHARPPRHSVVSQHVPGAMQSEPHARHEVGHAGAPSGRNPSGRIAPSLETGHCASPGGMVASFIPPSMEVASGVAGVSVAAPSGPVVPSMGAPSRGVASELPASRTVPITAPSEATTAPSGSAPPTMAPSGGEHGSIGGDGPDHGAVGRDGDGDIRGRDDVAGRGAIDEEDPAGVKRRVGDEEPGG